MRKALKNGTAGGKLEEARPGPENGAAAGGATLEMTAPEVLPPGWSAGPPTCRPVPEALYVLADVKGAHYWGKDGPVPAGYVPFYTNELYCYLMEREAVAAERWLRTQGVEGLKVVRVLIRLI